MSRKEAAPAPDGHLSPQNLEAERALLGSIVIDNPMIDRVSAILTAGDFYREGHRKIFGAMCALWAAGELIDLVTLCDTLARAGLIDEVGGVAYVSSLADTVPVSTGAETYARIVKAAASRRFVIDKIAGLLETAYDQSQPADVIEEAARDVVALAGWQSVRQEAPSVGAALESAWARKDREAEAGVRAIKTGWPSLDRMLGGGFKPGRRPYLIAARPKNGKTAAALQICTHAAAAGVETLLCELELERDEAVWKAVSQRARVDFQVIDAWNFAGRHEGEFDRVRQTAEWLYQQPLRIDAAGPSVDDRGRAGVRQRPAQTIAEIRALVRRHTERYGTQLVVVDYVQRIKGPKEGMKEYDRVTAVSSALAEMAVVEFGIPFVVLAQINREGGKQQGGRPTSDTLKGSGGLEQDAESIILLHRPPVFMQEHEPEKWKLMGPEAKREAEFIVALNGSGPTGIIPMRFWGEFLRWYEVTDRYDDRNVLNDRRFNDSQDDEGND